MSKSNGTNTPKRSLGVVVGHVIDSKRRRDKVVLSHVYDFETRLKYLEVDGYYPIGQLLSYTKELIEDKNSVGGPIEFSLKVVQVERVSKSFAGRLFATQGKTRIIWVLSSTFEQWAKTNLTDDDGENHIRVRSKYGEYLGHTINGGWLGFRREV